jgi:hypothetical protein
LVQKDFEQKETKVTKGKKSLYVAAFATSIHVLAVVIELDVANESFRPAGSLTPQSMSRRSPETLADYLVVAIAPALIMLLVGSLMWFLVEVFYQGEYKGRLLWIMAMFVLAIVCIARISIEEGLARAALFGWMFAAVIALALVRLVSDGLFLSGSIMIMVWWAAHKLTWDCTVIDEDQDVSGQGLLQQMGLEAGVTGQAPSIEATTAIQNSREHWQDASATQSRATPPWWETLFEPDRRPHAPGVWVVYFSLAALPLFGIGGWFVPSADGTRRSLVFGLLVIYVASGMGLLLATSFLGLRRYLRQRRLEMPLEMTSTWILAGIAVIFATLIVATILPRPSREYSLSQLPFAVTSAVRKASQFAMGKEGTKDEQAKDSATTNAKEGQTPQRKGTQEGKGEAGGKTGEGKQTGDGKKSSDGKQSGEAGKSQSGGGEKGDAGGKSQDGKSKGGQEKGRSAESQNDQKQGSDQQEQSHEQQNDGRQRGEQQQNQNGNQPPPQPRSKEDHSQQQPNSQPNPSNIVSQVTSFLGSSLMFALQMLFYAVLICGGLIAAWIYREELMAAWRKLMIELQELWDWWFGKKKAAEQAAAELVAVAPPPRAFASYVDPFLSGDARGMSWPQLVRYTFEALEAWGRERSCPRASGQTPQEFAIALAGTQPQVASGVQMLAAWYGQLAYAPKAAAPGSVEPLRQLWAMLGSK